MCYTFYNMEELPRGYLNRCPFFIWWRMEQLEDSLTAIALFAAAAGAFAVKVGESVWQRLFGTRYITEEECRETRSRCDQHHNLEMASAAKELREIRKILVLVCHKMSIDPDKYEDLIL